MKAILCAGLLLAIAGCKKAEAPAADQAAAPRDEGWTNLFDGSSVAAWRGYRQDSMPSGWRIENGTLTKDTVSGDIMTREQFGDFELELEWKLDVGGNAGIFYRGTREYDYIFWSAPEYQLLDDANAPDGKNRLTSAASNFGLYAAPAGIVKPHGEWNAARIVVDGAHVEHWLNGRKVVEYELRSPDWKAKVAASKFGKYPNFGLAAKGLLGIQGDHPGMLALRNLRVRALR